MKKKEKQNRKRLLQPVVSLEDLVDSPMFKKFNSCVDIVLDGAEDTNFATLDKGIALLRYLIKIFLNVSQRCQISG